jgi:AcrR family transcriptional regulator
MSGSSARAEPAVADRLIESAGQVFSEKGYEGATVAEIARRAGLTTGAIYSRFDGKADLLLAAIDRLSAPGFELLFRATRFAGQSEQILSVAGRHLVDVDAWDAGELLLEAFVAARRDPQVAGLMRERLEERAGLVAEVVERAQAEGNIDPELDTEAITRFAHAIGLGFLLYRAVGVSLPASEPWEELIDRVVAGLTGPPAR